MPHSCLRQKHSIISKDTLKKTTRVGITRIHPCASLIQPPWRLDVRPCYWGLVRISFDINRTVSSNKNSIFIHKYLTHGRLSPEILEDTYMYINKIICDGLTDKLRYCKAHEDLLCIALKKEKPRMYPKWLSIFRKEAEELLTFQSKVANIVKIILSKRSWTTKIQFTRLISSQ